MMERVAVCLYVLKNLIYNLVILAAHYTITGNGLYVRIVALKNLFPIYFEGSRDKCLIGINQVWDTSLVNIYSSVRELLEQ